MAIVHRQRMGGGTAAAAGRSRLATLAMVVFGGLAVLVGLRELWPGVLGMVEGVTDIPGTFAPLLPAAARAGALVVLPAAVAWASPRTPAANGWLWRGALIVAVTALGRTGAEIVLLAIANGGDASIDTDLLQQVAQWLGILLGFAALLGTWAVSEGLKDAGGRLSRIALASTAISALAAGILVFFPNIMSALDPSAAGQFDVPLLLVSIGLNGLSFIVYALLAVRALAGARRRVRPTRAWVAGAIAGAVVFLVPLISWLRLVISQYVMNGADPLPIPDEVFRVATFFGWPLFAVALGSGMGRIGRRAPKLTSTGFTMRGKGRFTAAPAREAVPTG